MKTMYSYLFSALILVLSLWGCSSKQNTLVGSRPNVILIMADDLGYSDLGVHGNILTETPNLDQFASEAVQFSQFYVTPVCATTRAALLTGRHFLRTGVSHVHGGKDFLHLDEVTLANAFKEAGYKTGMWGKWHSGKTPGYYPWERGFDEAYMARLYQHKDNEGVMNGVPKITSGWTTEVLTDMALDFMDRNREQPFFAYLPFLTCHAPLKAPESYTQKYRDKGLSENLSTLYGMVDQLDFHIGRLLTSLEEMQLAENTIVLFLSDNGPAVINNLLTDEDRKIRYVNGLRGHKGNIWENGIKSPLFMKWPGHIENGVVEGLADVTDLFPTLMELAGADVEKYHLDGRSLLPLLGTDPSSKPGKEIFLYAGPGWPPTDKPWTPEGTYDEYRPWKFSGGDNLSYEKQIIGIRDEQYKLLYRPGETDGTIKRDGEGYVLIDIGKDPRERSNLAQEQPEHYRRMKALLEQWYQDVYSSPHAFEPPLFKVGNQRDMSYPVLAYGPRTTSDNVTNAAGYITKFEQHGDSASYTIDIEEKGVFQVDFSYRLKGNGPIHFEFTYSGHRYPFILKPNEQQVELRDLPFSKGISSFTVTRTSATSEGELRLKSMVFHHQ